MAEKSKAERKAMAMKKRKQLQAAGVPEGQMSKQMSGLDEYGSDAASSGRAMLEQKNNELAQELMRKQREKMMKGR